MSLCFFTCELIMFSQFWKTHEDSEYIYPIFLLFMSMIIHMKPGFIVHVGLSSLYPTVGLKWILRHQSKHRGCFKVSYYCFSSMAIIEIIEQFVGTVWSVKSQS